MPFCLAVGKNCLCVQNIMMVDQEVCGLSTTDTNLYFIFKISPLLALLALAITVHNFVAAVFVVFR